MTFAELKALAKREARKAPGEGVYVRHERVGVTAQLGLRNVFTYEYRIDGELVCQARVRELLA